MSTQFASTGSRTVRALIADMHIEVVKRHLYVSTMLPFYFFLYLFLYVFLFPLIFMRNCRCRLLLQKKTRKQNRQIHIPDANFKILTSHSCRIPKCNVGCLIDSKCYEIFMVNFHISPCWQVDRHIFVVHKIKHTSIDQVNSIL